MNHQKIFTAWRIALTDTALQRNKVGWNRRRADATLVSLNLNLNLNLDPVRCEKDSPRSCLTLNLVAGSRCRCPSVAHDEERLAAQLMFRHGNHHQPDDAGARIEVGEVEE